MRLTAQERTCLNEQAGSQPLGEGVSELRLFFGPGYRVYFGEDEGNIVVLLCGGDKSN